MQNVKPVILVGMMGAGKSSIGRSLADALAWAFVDSDTEIERDANMPIADIFEKYGEARFRERERRVIARLLDGNTPRVIASGGGAFMDGETRALIKTRAISIWLKASLDSLVQRATRKTDTRPLLKNGDPRTVIKHLLTEREPIYAQADFHIESDAQSRAETVEQIRATIPQLETCA